MNITIHSTDKIVTLSGVPARIWEGTTDSGIKMHCYITRVAIDLHEPNTEQFNEELQSHKAPSAEVEVIPLRLIL